jgi:hypothetical protein
MDGSYINDRISLVVSMVSTHCMALVYPISQFYLCTELKILFLWTLLIVF